MPVVNITDLQYKSITEPQGLLEQILTQPWAWLCILAVVIIVGIYLLRPKHNNDPSTKPFYGVDVRKLVAKTAMKKRSEVLGSKCKYHLRHAGSRIGIAVTIENDKDIIYKEVLNPKTKTVMTLPSHYVNITRFKYREYGLWAYLKAMFGYGFDYWVLTPDSYTIVPSSKKEFLYIDPTIHIINDSDIWTVADVDVYASNKDLILKIENENLHGFALDNLRRQAVYQSSVQASLEKLSHEQKLKDEEREKRNKPYM